MWQRNNKVSKRERDDKFGNFCKINANKDNPREERYRRKTEVDKTSYLPSFLLEPTTTNPVKPETADWKSVVLNCANTENSYATYDTKNPKMWKNKQWQGPVIMRNKNNNKIINKGASSQYIQSTPQYSRDEVEWHDSWESAFTPDEWNRMQEIQEEKEGDHMKMVFQHSFNKRMEESYRYFTEQGELDDFAVIIQEDEEYERYLQRLEDESEEESDEDNHFDDIV